MTSTPERAQPVAEGVEQPRRAVQADRGLAGAGRALDADGLVDARPDDLVLLGLDGGDDVAHRADARPLDLLGEDLAAARRASAAVAEVLVLVGGDAAVVQPEPAAQHDAHRLGAGRPVEGASTCRPASR